MSNNCIIDDNKTLVPIEIPKTQLDLNFDSFIEALLNGFNLDTVSLESVSEVSDALNKRLRQATDLRAFYQKIVEHVAHLVGADCAQQWGTVRVNVAGQRSVPFHIDKWSGHPSKLVNVWIPLTKLDETNTLHYVSPTKTKSLIEQLRLEKPNLIKFDKDCFAASELFLDDSKFFLFSNELLHGTATNQSSVRMSLDFRLAFSNAFDGRKIIGQDYVFIDTLIKKRLESTRRLTVSKSKAKVLLFQENNFSNVSHSAQRSVCRLFCESYNLSIIEEGSEFQGFSNFPQLRLWLDGNDSDEVLIVLPSFQCVKDDGQTLKNFSEIIAETNTKIFFALEGSEARAFFDG